MDKEKNKMGKGKQFKNAWEGKSYYKLKDKSYIDEETGERIEGGEFKKINVDRNFVKLNTKLYKKCEIVLGVQSGKVLYHIFDSIQYNNNNRFISTYREIVKDTKVSLPTVRRTIEDMLEQDLMIKEKRSMYMVNPELLHKGSKEKRMYLKKIYDTIKLENQANENRKRLKLIDKTTSGGIKNEKAG